MPFTFSHPAIVLPFLKIRRTWVSMSGLIIGSMTPDFEYLIKMKLSGRYAHSLEGMFLFDLPVACVIAFVFHFLVKEPLINNLPNYFYKRLIPLKDFDFLTYVRSHFLGFACCLLIGIGSHILWDGFTHANEFEKNIPLLNLSVPIGSVKLPLFRVLQHVSTAVGAAFIFLIFHRQPVQPGKNSPSYIFWIIVLVLASVAFTIRASYTFEYLGDIVCTIMSSGIIGLITASFFSRMGWV